MFLAEPPPTPEVLAAYADDRAAGGHVDNLTRAWCWRPDVMDLAADTRAALLASSELTEREVAVLVTATAAARQDSYCALAWGSRLAAHADPDTAAAVAAGTTAGLGEREAALARWARQVVTDPNGTSTAGVDALRAVGLTDRGIFEATTLIALRLAFSTVNDALGVEPDRQLADGAPPALARAVTYGRAPAVAPSS
ncbi:hypothetical protein JL107_06120 [Nakamurella flavida]|uniref:Carboxymuconolactone decarboxylase family protein n=1 Tax=Nakamurella flavida TaxID=363630 RepID=A0A938YMN3_9ACTN|nr:hypothetical protein [Nakamurella flavida]MBM9476014.1 hypothetical protein [Nakamurella flavida]MDP9777243.1 putative peroxidase-related enzyme [Nakamurella flavida]